jgi:hypothetical protein
VTGATVGTGTFTAQIVDMDSFGSSGTVAFDNPVGT